MDLSKSLFVEGTEVNIVIDGKITPGAIIKVSQGSVRVLDGEGIQHLINRDTLRSAVFPNKKLVFLQTIPFAVSDLRLGDAKLDDVLIAEGVNVDGLTIYNQVLVTAVSDEMVETDFFGVKTYFVRSTLEEYPSRHSSHVRQSSGWKFIGKWAGARLNAN